MGLQTVPGYIGQAAYQHPVELDRNMLEGLFGRTGILRVGDFVIAATGTAQQISITAGRAFLLGAENAQQGGYFVWSDQTENKVFGPPSGSARIDSLILRVVDTQYGSDPGSPRAEWDIVAGVPSGSPTARPDSDFNTGGTYYKPGAWFRMADVRINPGDTVIPGGQITRKTKYVRNARSKYIITSTDTISDQVVGDEAYDIDIKAGYIWNGTAWEGRPGTVVGFGHVTAGTVATSVAAAEAAIPTASWAIQPSATLRTGHIYKAEIHYAMGISASTNTVANVRLRKGAQTTSGQVLQTWVETEAVSGIDGTHYKDTWIKNVSGADITTAFSLTIQRISASNNAWLSGDAALLLRVTFRDEGPEAGHIMSSVATAIV